MISMFDSCTNLTNITALANWNMSNVTIMSGMFESCTNLSNITALANWNTSNVTNMWAMFYNCTNLTDITAYFSRVSFLSHLFFLYNNYAMYVLSMF